MSRTEILKRYGIIDRPKLLVRPTEEADVLWRVGINGQGDPLTAIDVGGALKLANELNGIGEAELAAHIIDATNTARRSQVQGL
jgi:hypothetical protein